MSFIKKTPFLELIETPDYVNTWTSFLYILHEYMNFFFYISFHSSGIPWTFKLGEPTSTATLTTSPFVWSFWLLSRNFKYTIQIKIQWQPDFLCKAFGCCLKNKFLNNSLTRAMVKWKTWNITLCKLWRICGFASFYLPFLVNIIMQKCVIHTYNQSNKIKNFDVWKGKSNDNFLGN